MPTSPSFFFGGISIAQSFFLATYFAWRARSDVKFAWLGLYFLALGLRVFKSIFSRVLTSFSIFGSSLGFLGLMSAGPALYLFIKYNEGKVRITTLILHFLIPISIAITLMFVVPQHHHVVWCYRFATLHFLVYVGAATYNAKTSGRINDSIIQYLILISAIFLLVFSVQLLFNKTVAYTTGTFVASSIFYCSTFYFLILQKRQQGNGRITNAFSQERASEIERQLRTLLVEKKLYRQKGLTLTRCALELGVPAYILSKAINLNSGTNFNVLVNHYRIADVKELLSDVTNTAKVEHLATEVGFSGVSSLYASFKRETGTTIDAFRKQVRY